MHIQRFLPLAFLTVTTAFAAPTLTQVDVFTSGQDGYHTYRIPAIETAADGSLIAFAEARKYTREDPGFGRQDVDLVYKRSTDNGATWSKMAVLEDFGEEWSSANPATILDRTNGKLWVFYIRGRPKRSSLTARPGSDDMANFARWSGDNGKTWSEPIDLTSVARDLKDPKWNVSIPGPGGAIQTSKGRLLIAFWEMPYAAFTVYSDDHGQTWHRGQKVPTPKGPLAGSENQVAELNDGRILLDMRQDEGVANRWFAESSDGGVTWTPARTGITVTAVACALERYVPAGGKARLLSTGPIGKERKHLVLRSSTDDGKTFGAGKTISTDFAAYSETTVLKDNSLGVLWERGTKTGYEFITFTRVNQDWILAP